MATLDLKNLLGKMGSDNKMSIGELHINKKAFSKGKTYKLCAGVIATSLLLGSFSAIKNNIDIWQNIEQTNHPMLMSEHRNSAEVTCNFTNITEDSHVVFVTPSGDIMAIINVNEYGNSKNLTAHLKPGEYIVVGNVNDSKFEFEINDVNDDFVLDINCETGELSLNEVSEMGKTL